MNTTTFSIRLLFPAILLFTAGCQSAITPSSPASLPSPQILTQPVPGATATFTDIPFATISLTPTISPTPTIEPAAKQLDLLYQSSLKYLAETDDQAWEVAKALEYAPLGGYPSNMCGPLAVSLLKDAGILGQGVDLHDFWLLDPLVDAELLQATFPLDSFQWLHSDQPINKIDFTELPLKAGDMVYIYSGKLGDYSHVLTVSRVDDQGRAFSVTNNYTIEGFVILEYLLYDPTLPGEGIFYEWPDPANYKLGLTGLGGIDIWRPLNLPYYADGTP